MDSTKYIDNTKYIGMDVHKETVSIVVMNSAGKLVMESILETKAATILAVYPRAGRQQWRAATRQLTAARWPSEVACGS
jgi:hypothetical protein